MADDKTVVLKVIEEVVQKKFFSAIGKGKPEEPEEKKECGIHIEDGKVIRDKPAAGWQI